ncbi:WcaG Nucleoside-diphosphate-sugar epimerases [uncultured Caudovirales phage]|uniref:WcaG Nucleoside-diphosphate-sugar epimerases n=1 Tax=uncultured Caudovirales phage TaxID=2100421 RepID=A0A6J5R555_9CAUD|nr:WcaG Nucleoside-diphosphate-sugar epimerases [uncultured Caudovirales phage]CAB4179918.1 WcaG Nucleoside-diphosphate-sugar epimerases [uncultured Caudovirales phage]CAB4188758.1 WcaG Nucleoside-diphosphate-sugar epimerases [uncultured Caudovirales phage]
MKALVTGASGYIGRALYKLNQDVIGIDLYNEKDYPYIEVCDVTDIEALSRVFDNNDFDVVIHLAGDKSVEESKAFPTSYFRSIVTGSLNVVHLCEQAGIPLVFASSAAVYGEESPYSMAKAFVERALEFSDLDYIALRYFNVGGLVEAPSFRQKGNVFDVIRDCHNYDTTFYINSGSLGRDYSHVLDIAEATWEAVAAVRTGLTSGTYDVLSGASFTLDKVIELYKGLGVWLTVYEVGSPVESEAAAHERPWPHTPKFGMKDIIQSEIEHGLTKPESS